MDELVNEMSKEMEKTVEALKASFKTIRSGAVNPSVLDKVQADYYGEKTPIRNLASISAPLPTQLLIKVFDPSAVKAIAGAIGQSDLGVNPQIQGNAIRLTFPPLSGERRKENAKIAKGYADKARVGVRNIRGEYVSKVQKSKDFSEDMKFNLKNDIQKETDKFNKEIETLAAAKEKELLTL